MKKVITLAILGIFVTACSTTDGPNQVGGKILGGVAGALLGSQFGKGDGRLVAVGVGALLGSHIGGKIGHKMDERDKMLADQAAKRALEHTPDHRAVTWKNPNNNHRGRFTAINTEESRDVVCRDYVHTVLIDGQEEKIHGRACRDVRDPQGKWFVKRG